MRPVLEMIGWCALMILIVGFGLGAIALLRYLILTRGRKQ
jgi:hypothetical protein